MRRSALAIIVFGVFGAPLLAEDLGPAFAGYAITSMAGLGTPGQFVEVGTLAGTIDFKDNNSPLEHGALHCVGSLQPSGQGLCVISTMVEGGAEAQATGQETENDEGSDPGLNHLFASYECTAAAAQDVPAGTPGAGNCALTITEGIGTFEGATGSFMMIAAYPFSFHGDGTASGFATITSFDLVLPQ